MQKEKNLQLRISSLSYMLYHSQYLSLYCFVTCALLLRRYVLQLSQDLSYSSLPHHMPPESVQTQIHV